MARTFSLKLTLLFDQSVEDAAGTWRYAAASAVDQLTGESAQLIATKRENGFSNVNFPASMLTATVMFVPEPGAVAPNMTLQGIHDLASNNETGSVSAASPEFADQIGGTFSFDAATGVLNIEPPAGSVRSRLEVARQALTPALA